MNLRGQGDRGIDAAGEGDQGDTDALQGRQESRDLLGLTAVRDGDDDVALHDPAQVAVDGLGGMKEERWSARGGEGRGEFLRNETAFAHTRGDDPAGAGEEHVNGPAEGVADFGDEVPDRVGFDLEDLESGFVRHFSGAPEPARGPS